MAWAISTPPPTRCSAASWRSRFSPIATRRTSRSASGSHGRRWRPPASPVSRTPSRSSTSASTTDVPTSSWSTSAGGSLDDILRAEGARPPEQVFTWLEEAARALDVAHREGVVHRDVKPANLLLDAEGHVHVADFGIASAAGMHSLTMTGTVLGTAGYLSPEQARGERAGPASDRYALAIVAWELLTGRRPFESESPTAEAAAHVNAPIPSVCERSRASLRARSGLHQGAREGPCRALRHGRRVRRCTTRSVRRCGRADARTADPRSRSAADGGDAVAAP